MHVSLNHHSNTDRVPIQMTEANFRTFQHYKSQKIIEYNTIQYNIKLITRHMFYIVLYCIVLYDFLTYSSVIYGLLTHIQCRLYDSKKAMDIKLPVPIIDAKIMLSFSTLRKLHHKNHFGDGLLFQDHILQFHDFS